MESEFPKLAKVLDQFTSKSSLDAEPLIRRAIDAHFRLGQAQNFEQVLNVVMNANYSQPMRAEALNCIGEWANPGPRDRVTGFWNPLPNRDLSMVQKILEKKVTDLLSKTSSKLQADAVSVITRLKVKVDDKLFLSWITDAKMEPTARIAALKYLQASKSAEFPKMVELALKESNPRLRSVARDLFTSLDASKAVKSLEEVLTDPKAELFEKQQALETIARWKNPGTSDLLDKWAEMLAEKKVPAELQLDLQEALKAFPSGKRQPLLQKFEAGLTTSPFGKHPLALVGGDAERGRELFVGHAAAQCVRCHTVNGNGGNAGPELSKVVTKYPEKTREYLLESMINPNAKIAPGFGSIRVVLFDGKSISGTLQEENAKSVTITTPEGKKVTVEKEDIESRSVTTSAMPSVERTLSSRELRDLVEYLMTLK